MGLQKLRRCGLTPAPLCLPATLDRFGSLLIVVPGEIVEQMTYLPHPSPAPKLAAPLPLILLPVQVSIQRHATVM